MSGRSATATCLYCGRTYAVHPYRLGKSRFCSYECYWNAIKGRATHPCPVCGTPTILKHTYCSKACSFAIDRADRRPIADVFWTKVLCMLDTRCWEWQGGRFSTGYGVLRHRGAHRVSYELNVGPIPRGQHVMHSCDNPPCVNPAHLTIGTPRDNIHDMVAKGRAAWQ